MCWIHSLKQLSLAQTDKELDYIQSLKYILYANHCPYYTDQLNSGTHIIHMHGYVRINKNTIWCVRRLWRVGSIERLASIPHVICLSFPRSLFYFFILAANTTFLFTDYPIQFNCSAYLFNAPPSEDWIKFMIKHFVVICLFYTLRARAVYRDQEWIRALC